MKNKTSHITTKIGVAWVSLTMLCTPAFSQQDDPFALLENIRSNWEAAGFSAWINDDSSNETAVGDKIEFRFRAASVGYIGIVYIDSSQSAAIIIPSENDEPALIQANTDLVYPSEQAGFQFRAVAPTGMERAYLIFSDRPIRPSRIGDADEYGFIEVNDFAIIDRFVDITNEIADQGLVAVASLQHMTVAAGDEATMTGASPPVGEAIDSPVVDNNLVTPNVEVNASSGAADANVEAMAAIGQEPAGSNPDPANEDPVDKAESNIAPGDLATAAKVSDIPGASDVSMTPKTPDTDDVMKSASIPDLPDVPDIPKSPKVPDTDDLIQSAGIPDIPDAPKIPKVPKVPDSDDLIKSVGVPDIPDTPKIPKAPKVPDSDDLIKSAGVPDIPDTPKIPKAPKVPDSGDLMKSAGVPDIPDAPKIPKVPKVPDSGDLLKSAGVPDIPDVPKIPKVPKVPDSGDLLKSAGVPDIPDAPKIPKAPKAPSTGNVLGRVISSPKILAGGPSKIGAAAGDAATAMVANKLFGLVTGSPGKKSNSDTSSEQGDVSRLVAEIDANPEVMDPLAAEYAGAVGAIRHLARSSNPDEELVRSLQQIETEVDGIVEVYYCTTVSDCELAPLGEDFCGNPGNVRVYSTKTTDVPALQARVRDYDSFDAVRRYASASDQTAEANCADALTPEMQCERNICELVK